MKKLGYREIGLNLLDLSGILKEEKVLYMRSKAEDELITYQIFLNDVIDDYDKISENENIFMISEKDKKTNFYISGIENENDLDKIIKIIEENTKNKKAKIQEKKIEIDENLKNEILRIISNKDIITELKEKYEDIEQLTYVLKNQVNFMTFLYIFTEEIKLTYENYQKIYDWYLELSQDFVKVREYSYMCEDTARIYFENQLKDITEVYNILYTAWKSIKIDKKFNKGFFEKNVKKISETFFRKIIERKIFEFLKGVGEWLL